MSLFDDAPREFGIDLGTAAVVLHYLSVSHTVVGAEFIIGPSYAL
ncbi:hypothetical protein [Sphingomonas telluris]|nr:hypothetical protein [Sphingomonas telluris]